MRGLPSIPPVSYSLQVLSDESVAEAKRKMPYIRAVERNPEDPHAWLDLAYCQGGRINGTTYDKSACYGKVLGGNPR